MAKFDTSTVNTLAMVVIVIAVLFSALASIVPQAQSAGDELTDEANCEDEGGYWNASTDTCQVSSTNTTTVDYTGIPLGNLFSGSGVVFVIVMASIFLVVMYGALRYTKK